MKRPNPLPPDMMTAAERCQSDPYFSMLVKMFYGLFQEHNGSGAGITPSEIREASGYAWQLYIERHAQPLMIIREPDA